MSRPYKLIIFDWDGTLMDSQARIVSCIQAACRDLKLPVPDEAAAKNVIGLGLQEACRQLLPESRPPVHQEMSERYRYHFLSANATPSELFGGVEAMLDELEQRGHFLAIATGKGRQGLDSVLKETGLQGRFHATRTSDETASKPNPLMLHELLDFFGVETDEALMIGDTEYDMEMAVHARMDALAVSYGVHEVERLLRHAPLACVDSIPAMQRWLINETV
ncbi:MAG: HAD-IA family hydrolase [Gammaproteobacteria bacterium]|nr:HAD-IA family hydrolase [Gammaproteobacteria bacterium]